MLGGRHDIVTDPLHQSRGGSIWLVEGELVLCAAQGAAILVAGMVEILNAGSAEGMPT